MWFRDQPEPLLNSLSEPVIQEGQGSAEKAGKVIMERMHYPASALFVWLLDVLVTVADYPENRMNIHNLGKAK